MLPSAVSPQPPNVSTTIGTKRMPCLLHASAHACRSAFASAYALAWAASLFVSSATFFSALATSASAEIAAFPAHSFLYLATVYHLLGINPRGVIHDLQGRPYYLVDGEPVHALMT